MRRTAVVTDTSAQLDEERAAELGVTIVPLQVIIDDEAYDETAPEAHGDRIVAALRAKRSVSTSRPGPAVLAEVYQRLIAEGNTEILSIHLSGAVSGTYESAQLAAREVDVPIRTVDTRQVGPATGYAVVAAVERLRDGATLDSAAKAARERAAAATSLFYVDTLEFLRRGGRIGAAAGFLGGVLAVKPILTVEDGAVAGKEKVRTASKALARLEALAVEAADEADGVLDICVAHLANPDAAATLAENLNAGLGDRLGDGGVRCGELSAVLGAHAGPGVVAVCVAPRL